MTTSERSRRGQRGIRLHRVRRLYAQDRACREGIPLTSVARTLLDLAEVAGEAQLERAFEQAERLQLLNIRAVRRLCERSHGRRGVRSLRALLDWRLGPYTRSELERRFAQLCRDAGLAPPAQNVVVAGFEVDALWLRHGLVVELDGFEFHRTRAAFERNRARDTALQLAGYRVVRITARRLADEPDAVVETIRSLVARPRS